MSKEKIIFILGVWIVILPYLGFPLSLKNILLSISGLGIIYLGYLFYKNSKIEGDEKRTFDNFSENSNFNENFEKDSEFNKIK